MYDPTRDYYNHKEEYDQAIHNVLESGEFINGPSVSALERELEKYTGSKNCITVGNGTDALQIALMAINIQKGDEVITTAHTWISSSESIALLGAIPVFVDIEVSTFNIDATKIEEKITDKTKAILPVNLYGLMADYTKILEISKKYNLYVIEDAAQSFGSELYKMEENEYFTNIKSCNFDEPNVISCTSFFPSKTLGCYGDGGAIFTNNSELATKIRAIKNHGGKRFEHKYIGVNSRLDTIQAAVLLVKLKNLDQSLINRNIIAKRYTELLSIIPNIKLPLNPIHGLHVWSQYTILVPQWIRDKLFEYLSTKISVSIYYPKPLHLQECFEYLGYKETDLPNTELACKSIINVPCYAELSFEEQDYIVNLFYSFFNIDSK